MSGGPYLHGPITLDELIAELKASPTDEDRADIIGAARCHPDSWAPSLQTILYDNDLEPEARIALADYLERFAMRKAGLPIPKRAVQR